MPYHPPRESYNRYLLIRWWCQNQWWVQIVVPCVICAGVIGALLYHWNNERQTQMQSQIFETQYKHWKEHPPELDPDLDEKAAAWRVIRMKKNDPSMPIPYKKKQLIVKHWKSIIVDMKAEEIQRLHDLLQDQPLKPTDDIEIDVRKFDAPWKGDVTLDGMDSELVKAAPLEEDMPDPSKEPEDNLIDESGNADQPGTLKLPQKPVSSDSEGDNQSAPTPKNDSEPQNDAPNPAEKSSPNTDNSQPADASTTPANSTNLLQVKNSVPDYIEPIPFLADNQAENGAENGKPVTNNDAAENPESNVFVSTDLPPEAEVHPIQDSVGSDADSSFESEQVAPIDIDQPEPSSKQIAEKTPTMIDEVGGPLEDNYRQQREKQIKKMLDERQHKIEEFKRSQDPNQFIPSPWKRNPLVI